MSVFDAPLRASVHADDRTAGSVGDDLRADLVSSGGRYRHAVDGPLRNPGAVDALGVDVGAEPGHEGAVVFPDDDRPAGAVRDQLRIELAAPAVETATLSALAHSSAMNPGLLGAPPTVTITEPVVAPEGTIARIWTSLQLVMLIASTPPIETVPAPWAAPNPAPVMTTSWPTRDCAGLTLVTTGPEGAAETRIEAKPATVDGPLLT